MNVRTKEPVLCSKVLVKKDKNDNPFTHIEFAWMGGKKDFFDREGLEVMQGELYHLEMEINGKYINLVSVEKAKKK